MADNKKLTNAKAEKNGEYYTEYSTIAKIKAKLLLGFFVFSSVYLIF